jgi:hypothetical protein
MTDQELRDMIANFSATFNANLDRSRQEAETRHREFEREFERERRAWRQEFELEQQTWHREAEERKREAEERKREYEAQQQETNKQIRELGKQIGGLGNKFGSFTESLALPSAERLVNERFGADAFTAYLRRSKNGEHIEIDGFGFNNGERNEGYIIEVKSKLDERGLEQAISIIQRFRSFFPEFADKTLYGIIAIADVPTKEMLQRAYASGLYVMQFHDDLMEFSIPENFVPRAF